MSTNLPEQSLEFRARVSGAARRIFIRIAEVWSLTDAEQIDLLALDNFAALEGFRRPSDEPLSSDVLYRISYVLGIYKALPILLPDAAIADGAIRRPNSNVLFGGKSALDLMTTRDLADLAKVRAYLDAQLEPQWG